MKSSSTPETTLAVQLVGITKAYPGVVANDNIDISLHKGEVHILLGENGAGKSTLISILSGMISPDSGTIYVDGAVAEIKSPRDSLELGIGTVYQHSLLVPTLTVLESMMLGTTKWYSLDRESAEKRLAELVELLDIKIDADAIIGDLALGQRQQVEIVRALWRGEGALILDEPTSMLTPQGVESLRKVVERIAGQGLSVLFITHKLDEALDFGDRITVLRRGRKVGELDPDELASSSPDDSKKTIIDLIFGSVSEAPISANDNVAADAGDEAESLDSNDSLGQSSVQVSLQGLVVTGDGPRPLVDSVSFDVRKGEIFGIAGIDGNGQKELAEAIAGQRKLDAGKIFIDGEPVQNLSVAARQDIGVRYVTDDRHGEGTVGELSISMNTVLKRIGQRPFWRRARIRHSLIRQFATTLIDDHDVRTPHEQIPIANLSGGNMQKVVVGRELAMGPRVVVYNKPTYGLDVKTADAVLARIASHARGGTVAILISTELDELISTCDRIGVMHDGQMTGILTGKPGIEIELGELMTGAAVT